MNFRFNPKTQHLKFDETVPERVSFFWTLQQGLSSQPKTQKKAKTAKARHFMQNFFFLLIAISNAWEKRKTPIAPGKRISSMINSELIEAIGSSSIKMRHLAWLLTYKIEPHDQESPHHYFHHLSCQQLCEIAHDC